MRAPDDDADEDALEGVDESSDESFPASDPPSWTMGRQERQDRQVREHDRSAASHGPREGTQPETELERKREEAERKLPPGQRPGS
jgi:hypothetical protein